MTERIAVLSDGRFRADLRREVGLCVALYIEDRIPSIRTSAAQYQQSRTEHYGPRTAVFPSQVACKGPKRIDAASHPRGFASSEDIEPVLRLMAKHCARWDKSAHLGQARARFDLQLTFRGCGFIERFSSLFFSYQLWYKIGYILESTLSSDEKRQVVSYHPYALCRAFSGLDSDDLGVPAGLRRCRYVTRINHFEHHHIEPKHR